MRIPVAAVLIIGSVFSARGEGEPIEIRPFLAAAPRHNLGASELTEPLDLKVFMEIANVSDRVCSIAVEYHRSDSTFIGQHGDRPPRLIVHVAFGKTMSGLVYIPSARELDVVELRPGEAFEVELRASVPKGTHLRDVVCEYVVDEDFGKRFGVWYGKVSSPLLAQPARRYGPNQPPQRNAGGRPSSGDSPASETPSSLGPRG